MNQKENLKPLESPKGDDKNWSVQTIWNDELTFGRKERALVSRDRMWASELGKGHYERYLKMTGIAPDFDYEERVLRKFEAGNFFERLVGFVLMSSGLLKFDNKWYQIPADDKHLAISVKPDFIAGGKPNWEAVKNDLQTNMLFELMPSLARISKRLVEFLSSKYPDGLGDLVYEIKSVNSQVFWSKKDYLSDSYPHHQLQCFAEMKATGLPEGRIFYISKDDLTVAEFPLKLSDPDLNARYEKDVTTMTNYIRKGIEPPKPESVVFDPRKKLRFQYLKEKRIIQGCYVENWEIIWSNYISHITGIKGKTQAEVASKWKNRIYRIAKDKNEQLKTIFKARITPDE